MGARESRPSGAQRLASLRLAILTTAIALLCAGCNIFSWTHDEGSSNDPETLLADAEGALLKRDYDAALQYASKGIQNDPHLAFPRLRYVASQAVLARAGISISDYFRVFTNRKATADGRHPVVRYDLLNLTAEELRTIASACPQATVYLRELIEGLQDGVITTAALAGARFDVDVGFAVGSLLTAFVTILDADQDLSNGFERHPDITIVADDFGGYDIEYTGTQPRDAFISCNLVCPLWSRAPDAVPGYASICEALEGIYDAYLTSVGADPDASAIGCTESSIGEKPASIDMSAIVGQMLDFVYDGVAALFLRYGPCPCAGGGP